MLRVEQSFEAHTKKIDASGGLVSAEIPYIVFEAGDEDEALKAVLAIAPKTLSNSKVPLTSLEIDERCNESTYKVNAVYETELPGDNSGSGPSGGDNNPTVNFDCSAGTKHMTQALSQTCVYGADDDEKADAVPIGWNGKFGSLSEIAGVDVSTGELRETYTKYMSVSKVTGTNWKKNVAALVGKVNSGNFKGWPKGEVMFLGCSYSAPLRGSSRVAVSFQFAIRSGETETIAGQNISKQGFEYVWALTDENVKDGKRTREVRKIYRAKVCESDSFGGLGI